MRYDFCNAGVVGLCFVSVEGQCFVYIERLMFGIYVVSGTIGDCNVEHWLLKWVLA
jgi:hypothetical protein